MTEPFEPSRQDAIDELLGDELQLIREFCVGQAEEAAAMSRVHACLRALGVTDLEMGLTRTLVLTPGDFGDLSPVFHPNCLPAAQPLTV